MVWNALIMTTSWEDYQVKMRVIAVSATMKKIEIKLRKALASWV